MEAAFAILLPAGRTVRIIFLAGNELTDLGRLMSKKVTSSTLAVLEVVAHSLLPRELVERTTEC